MSPSGRLTRLRGPRGQRVTILSGILGLSSDADLVRAEFAREKPVGLFLGIPYEDLDAVRATAGQETTVEFDSGDLDDTYLEQLQRFGAVSSPPPDLYAAWQLAEASKVPVEAIDLDDEPFAEAYTKHVGMLEVWRSSRNQRRLLEVEIQADSAEAFARSWDAALYPTKGLRRVQEEREAALAQKLVGKATGRGPYLALVPLPRADGLVRRLVEAGWRVDP